MKQPRGAEDNTAPEVVIGNSLKSAAGQIGRLPSSGTNIDQMLQQLMPAVKAIGDDVAGYALLNAIAQLCVGHANSMANFWEMASRAFVTSPPLLRLVAIAITKAAPEYAVGCWRALAAAEPGYGEASTAYAQALLDRARNAIDESKVSEAVSSLHELRHFGTAAGNHEWLYEGLPLLAQLNFAVGNERLGLDQYKSFRSSLPHAGGNQHVFSSPVSALSHADACPGLKIPPRLVVPQFMPRVDFNRIGSAATFERTIEVLPEATVIPSCIAGSHVQAVLTRDRKLLIDQYNLHPRYYIAKEKSFLRSVSPDGYALIDFTYHRYARFLPGVHVLVGGAPNYYHWLFEYLPRLKVVLDRQLSFDTILVNSGFQLFQKESLEILIGGKQALTYLNTDTLYSCERLHAPTIRPYSEAVGFLRTAFLREKSARTARRKLFISRSDAHPDRSRIANEDEVYGALERYGYERIVLSRLSFLEQVNLFSAAEVIVAAHGAALTNIVFAPSDCVIFEINNPTNRRYTFFEEIAIILGQPFRRLVFNGEPSVGFHSEDAACQVDIGLLIERINA